MVVGGGCSGGCGNPCLSLKVPAQLWGEEYARQKKRCGKGGWLQSALPYRGSGALLRAAEKLAAMKTATKTPQPQPQRRRRRHHRHERQTTANTNTANAAKRPTPCRCVSVSVSVFLNHKAATQNASMAPNARLPFSVPLGRSLWKYLSLSISLPLSLPSSPSPSLPLALLLPLHHTSAAAQNASMAPAASRKLSATVRRFSLFRGCICGGREGGWVGRLVVGWV